MTIVSSKEFASNQDKYLELAINERVFIRKGKHTFSITNVDENEELEEIVEYRKAKPYRGDAIPFDIAFDEIEAFIKE